MMIIITTLESRVIKPGYPSEALHVYRLNADVDERNQNQLSPSITRYQIKAMTGQTKHIDMSSLSTKRTETGGLHGLHGVLKIACDARVMLTTNVDVW